MQIRGDLCHEWLVKKSLPKLRFDERKDYVQWRTEIKDKWEELCGLDKIRENDCPLNFCIEKTEEKEGYKQIRFSFESERGAVVPCYLLVPNTGKEKYPVAITLQGHSTGFHNSIGEPKEGENKEYALGRGQFAVQAVKRGYIALAIEQRAMGERKTERHAFPGLMCTFASMTAISLGRTVIGERVWDVSKAIDCLSNFSECDLENILITGNSGGGTTSFYAACFDERIKLSVPSCAFCSYEDSILDLFHCPCNYIPSMCEWFEMADLACLIAPRRLVLVSGEEDNIFPIDGVKKGYERVQAIYKKSGASENCRLVLTPKGHWWCEDIVWTEIQAEIKKI